jgi:PAS domain S-box-containing protein
MKYFILFFGILCMLSAKARADKIADNYPEWVYALEQHQQGRYREAEQHLVETTDTHMHFVRVLHLYILPDTQEHSSLKRQFLSDWRKASDTINAILREQSDRAWHRGDRQINIAIEQCKLWFNQQIADTYAIAESFRQLARCYGLENQLVQSLEMLYKGLRVLDAKDSRDSLLLGQIYHAMNFVQRRLGNKEMHRQALQKSFQILDNSGNGRTFTMANVMNSLGYAAIIDHDYRRAASYLQKAIGIYQSLNTDPRYLWYGYRNLIIAQVELGKIEDGFYSLYRLRPLVSNYQDQVYYAETARLGGLLHEAAGQYEKAASYYQEAIDNLPYPQHGDIDLYLTVLNESAEFFASQGDYALAYELLQEYNIKTDSLVTLEHDLRLAEKQLQTELELQEGRVNNLLQAKAIQDLQLEKTRLWVLLLLVLCILLPLTTFQVYRRKKLKEQHQLQEQNRRYLAREERKYRELVNNIAEVVVKADIDGSFTFLSRRWKDFTQYEPADTMGMSYKDFIHAQDVHLFESYLLPLREGKIEVFKVEFRHKRKDGSFFWAQAQARLEYNPENGEAVGIAGTLQNIEERKKAEIALQEREQMLSFIIEKSRDIISIHEPDLTIKYISPQVKQIVGFSQQEIIGKTTFDFIHPDHSPRIEQENQVMRTGHSVSGGKYVFRHKDGHPIWFEALPQPVFNESGEVVSIIVSHRDVTEKVKLEQELEKVRKKLAMDFHDELGNHLTTISMLARRLLLRINPEDKEMKTLAEKITHSSKYLYDGTRDFIWSINPEHDRLELIFLYLRDFGEELLAQYEITFLAEYEMEGLSDRLPPGQGQQIILIFKEAINNLLKHARASRAVLRLKALDVGYRLSLEDDGQGLSDQQAAMSSNGLQNMQKRAEKMQATLNICSKEGSGTVISLDFGIKISKQHDQYSYH